VHTELTGFETLTLSSKQWTTEIMAMDKMNHFQMFEVQGVRWMHYLHHSALLNGGFRLFSIVGFSWLHHILSLVDVIMGNKACTVLLSKDNLKAILALLFFTIFCQTYHILSMTDN
jgi:hypothetical protein